MNKVRTFIENKLKEKLNNSETKIRNEFWAWKKDPCWDFPDADLENLQVCLWEIEQAEKDMLLLNAIKIAKEFFK
jgi:hypothetical protein